MYLVTFIFPCGRTRGVLPIQAITERRVTCDIRCNSLGLQPHSDDTDRTAVSGQPLIMGEQHHAFHFGLRHEHTIKWIVMVSRKRSCHQGMLDPDGHRLESISKECVLKFVRSLKFASMLLDGNFPGCGGANENK